MVTNPIDEAISELPNKIRDRINSCPKSGQGVHQWLFSTALSLTNYFEDEQILEILNASVSCPGREQEIEKAVSNARRIAKGEGGSEPRVLWPAVDYATVHKIVLNSSVSLEKLRSASPLEGPKSEEIIDSLFPDNPLLCLAQAKNIFWTKPREFWRGKESGMQFIVPNEMTKPAGKTKAGKDSVRCLDNTGERKFLVVEFDIAVTGSWEPYVKDWKARGISTFDAQAALLVHLATKDAPRFRLTMAVHSGKKSLHGWFCCQGLPDEQTRAFMARAASLGADPATWTKCQLVRMPGGRRDDGNKQRVEYFNAGKQEGAK